jgi:hypothetical protein
MCKIIYGIKNDHFTMKKISEYVALLEHSVFYKFVVQFKGISMNIKLFYDRCLFIFIVKYRSTVRKEK